MTAFPSPLSSGQVLARFFWCPELASLSLRPTHVNPLPNLRLPVVAALEQSHALANALLQGLEFSIRDLAA